MLINNASIAETKISFDDEGHELHLKINHLGHFLLTHLLMDLLIATPKSRIINVSSITHEFITEPVNFTEAYYGNYSNPLQPHAVSKYANILFTHELQKRLDKKSVLVKTVVLHPGIVIPNHKAHLNEI
jgi:NAD(P)-dependent dehydrogenase (short-subunit alcohol dehydrogenase family)